MIDLNGPVEPWVGLLDVFGIAAVVLAWIYLRGASDRLRAIGAAVAAVFVVLLFARALFGASSIFAAIVGYGFDDDDGGRRVLDGLLLVTGVAVGAVGVLRWHRQAEVAAADVPGFEELEVEEEDEVGIAPSDRVVAWRQRIDALTPSADFAVLVLVLALPVMSGNMVFFGGGGAGFDGGEVTGWVATSHLLAGLVAALPLLVGVRSAEEADPRLMYGGFGLVALHAVVLPIWPEFFANEFWTAFGAGLLAGLLLPVVFALVVPAVQADRTVLVTGALVALAVLCLATYASQKEFFGSINDGEFLPADGPDVVVPSGFPTFPGFPTEFPAP